MEYSGIVQEGWNENGSYDRLQYSGEFSSLNEVEDFINDELDSAFEKSNRSRADLRLKVTLNQNEVETLQASFPNLEIAAFFNPDDFQTTTEIIVCKNNAEREIGEDALDEIKKATRNRIEKVSKIDVESNSINALNQILEKGYTIETEDFSAEELFELWSKTFGWEIEQCEHYADGELQNEKVYGLRDENGKMCAGVLISNGETTEWAVVPEKQGHGLITPLLIASHVDWTRENIDKVLQVFARYDRSVSPGLRTGLAPYVSGDKYVLTNHVTVSEDEPSDEWNEDKPDFNGTKGNKLRSFIIGQLDPKIITPKIQDNYLKHL